MKVFISWSGTRSRGVADALAGFLKKVIQSTEPFVSTAMEAGVKWNEIISQNHDDHGIGVLCVTPGNVKQPWLNFEAGALSRHLGVDGRVIPYLLDFGSPGNLKPPLSQFNAVTADRDGTWKLIQTLNGVNKKPQAAPDLEETFEAFWPKFSDQLEDIRTSSTQPPARRSESDKLDELLEAVRQLVARSTQLPAAALGLSGEGSLSAGVGLPNAELRQHMLGMGLGLLRGSTLPKTLRKQVAEAIDVLSSPTIDEDSRSAANELRNTTVVISRAYDYSPGGSRKPLWETGEEAASE